GFGRIVGECGETGGGIAGVVRTGSRRRSTGAICDCCRQESATYSKLLVGRRRSVRHPRVYAENLEHFPGRALNLDEILRRGARDLLERYDIRSGHCLVILQVNVGDISGNDVVCNWPTAAATSRLHGSDVDRARRREQCASLVARALARSAAAGR